jgi:uncharacterized protein YqhQ
MCFKHIFLKTNVLSATLKVQMIILKNQSSHQTLYHLTKRVLLLPLILAVKLGLLKLPAETLITQFGRG